MSKLSCRCSLLVNKSLNVDENHRCSSCQNVNTPPECCKCSEIPKSNDDCIPFDVIHVFAMNNTSVLTYKAFTNEK